MQFKSIPFIAKVKQSGTTTDVAKQLQSLIDTQATNGWAFETVETVKTIIQPTNGCFGLGAKPMFIDYISVATFIKMGESAPKSVEIREESVQTAVSMPLIVHQETVVQKVEKVIVAPVIEEEIDPKEIDYSSIFKPVEAKSAAILETLEDKNDAVLVTNVVDADPIHKSESVVPQPPFNAIEWINAHSKMLIIALVGVVVVFAVYKLLQPKPLEEAKKAVEMACKCEQDKTTQLITNLSNFNNSFEAAQFPTQIEARNAYNNAIYSTMLLYNNCKNQAENNKYEVRNKFNNYESIAEFDNIFDNQFNTSYKGDMTEYWRISGIVEGKISMLKADYSVVEPVVQTPEQQSLSTKLDALTGILMIEPTILNVRDKPNVDEGAIIFKAESGMRYAFVNQFTDDRGVVWYNIEMNGQNGWISGLYAHIEGIETTVLTVTTSFHSLNYNTLVLTKERQYLEAGQTVPVFKKFKEFIYTEYTNTRGVTTKGWLLMSDLRN
jgi:hypothetical protein